MSTYGFYDHTEKYMILIKISKTLYLRYWNVLHYVNVKYMYI